MPAPPLILYNSLTRRLERFVPAHPDAVRLYTCGPTVYNHAHIGNLRAYVFADTLRRVLQWKGHRVRHVINITDVGHLTSDADTGEDKMAVAAAREGRRPGELADRYTESFKADLARMNVLPPTVWARATEHVPDMVRFAEVLAERGFAYPLPDGLYFDTGRLVDYGRLGRLDRAGQREGARVDPVSGKRHPEDFAVWRRARTPGLLDWPSPWGSGIPGWHLECSCMSLGYLGDDIDIHTGGVDHRQVHHVNEIAQNQAYLGRLDDPGGGVRFWMHAEFITTRDGKMSKSAGTFVRLDDLIAGGHHPLAYRFLLLQASYRTPLEVTEPALQAAGTGLARIAERLRSLGPARDQELSERQTAAPGWAVARAAPFWESLSPDERPWVDRFDEALCKDLNTPRALAVLSELLASSAPARSKRRLAAVFDAALGLDLLALEPEALQPRPRMTTLSPEAVEAYLAERAEARRARNFTRADEIRAILAQSGIEVRDAPEGTRWEYRGARPEG